MPLTNCLLLLQPDLVKGGAGSWQQSVTAYFPKNREDLLSPAMVPAEE